MKEEFNDNKIIAIFMGWFIDVKITEDYPNQEWHTTRNNITKDWNSARCVHLNEKNVALNRITLDDELWESLCNNTFSRGGGYSTSWSELMPVIERIRTLSSERILGLHRYSLGAHYVHLKIEMKNQTFDVQHNVEKDIITPTFDLIVKFIKWYNKINK